MGYFQYFYQLFTVFYMYFYRLFSVFFTSYLQYFYRYFTFQFSYWEEQIIKRYSSPTQGELDRFSILNFILIPQRTLQPNRGIDCTKSTFSNKHNFFKLAIWVPFEKITHHVGIQLWFSNNIIEIVISTGPV